VIPEVLGIPRAQIAYKTRERQRGHAQYERQAARGEFIEVAEQGARLLVNLYDYLDTGLFLDHRPTRLWLRELARGRRFLNLFGYTGTATVHAALGGASATTTVDLSNTYLDWAEHNLNLNGLGDPPHQLVRADVREWLDAGDDDYDVIFLDPPTFSTSKRMEGTLDIQRDHVLLIRAAISRLSRDGDLIFSTNARRFRLDTGGLAGVRVEDVTPRTIARDFARNPRIHQCFRITHPNQG
jgi:23S rRNA (guanine2445-N2)-methyltransferase / 23S rRNA (guanine2069-N7)-methyltransferase